ncbi:LAME_0B04082g1_1 [Lachancea meyersii CBS 8951]|uniref:Heat shock transcription factor n=1 Tax=Lachancea meyersii CBS 8951 TaxID=1266667 RepID=A0A1G4IUQ6_9SACH|nr:LAME_0B04082g1_1 [Lachancea meyersii CBS 8951]
MQGRSVNQNNSHVLNDDDIESIINPGESTGGSDHRNSQPVVEDIVNPAWDPTGVMSPSNLGPQSAQSAGPGPGPFSPLTTHPSLIPMDHSGDIIRRGTPSGFYPGSASPEASRAPIHESLLSDTILMPYRNRLLKPIAKPAASVAPKQLPKRKLTSAKTRPAFVNKLWSMVNDSANAELMYWAPDGKSFIISNREGFVHGVLPKYFKHSNFASFVRQLNMYGWHKVQDVRSGSIQANSDERCQFENENFVRGAEDLLDNIVRQKPSPNNSNDLLVGQNGEEMDFGILLNELESVKFNQMAIAEDLKRISKDNELLWKENMMARERNQAQQQALNKILHLLTSLMGSNAQKLLGNELANELAQSNAYFNDMPTGNRSFWDLGGMNSSLARPRLLLKDSQRHTHSNGPTHGRDSGVHDPVQAAASPIQEIDRQYINNNGVPSAEPTSMSDVDGHVTGNSRASQSGPAFDSAASVDPNFFDDLESNIKKQGESIQELEDWITKMSPSHHNEIESVTPSAPSTESLNHVTGGGGPPVSSQPTPSNFDLQDYLATADPAGLTPLIQESTSEQSSKRDFNIQQPDEINPQNPAKKQKTTSENSLI